MEISKNANNEQTNKRNLYVKFIHENVDEEMLKKEFEEYGTVTSVKIQVDTVTKDDKEYKVHRGYGFVS